MHILQFSWTQFLQEMLGFLLYPLGDGFMNYIALVGVLLSVVFTMGAIASKLGTDPDAPFDLE